MDVAESLVKSRRVGAKPPSAVKAKPDLATVVRDRSLRDVLAGKSKVTLQHGLMAQQMIDKRMERAADRQLAIRIAAMLGGAPVPQGLIIDVTPLGIESGDDDDYDPTDE